MAPKNAKRETVSQSLRLRVPINYTFQPGDFIHSCLCIDYRVNSFH